MGSRNIPIASLNHPRNSAIDCVRVLDEENAVGKDNKVG